MVICVYTEDRWEDILAAVASVRAQSRPALETLLVVDHNQALLDRLSKEYKETEGVRVLANAGPRGLSAGRNTGIAASYGDVIAFLDDDAVAERDWLHHFAEGYADPLGHGRRRPYDADLGVGAPAGLVPRGVRLGRGLHVQGPAARPGPGAQRARRQRLVPAYAPSTRRAASRPASDATATSVRWAARRRSCASASRMPGRTRSC